MPRPNECARRAWHSDSHQPIRGYLIQEIFRIANEIHSSATKNNRQWQEKLPVVVLKAEEIIYSKANSEAEYADFNTVWERANDAIDTIIRRDKSSETGDLLLPCIEAALHLGCTPRKFSRSQRNNTPRFYLTPEKNEPLSTCSSIMSTTNCSFMPVNLNILLRGNTNSSHVIQENPKSPNVQPCSVFPLYYGKQFLTLEDSKKSKIPSNFMADDDDRESPITKLNASNDMTRTDFIETSETRCGGGCDLSLRLSPFCSNTEENVRSQELKFSVSVNSLQESRPTHMLSKMDIESSSFRKRKVVVLDHPSMNKQFCWH